MSTLSVNINTKIVKQLAIFIKQVELGELLRDAVHDHVHDVNQVVDDEAQGVDGDEPVHPAGQEHRREIGREEEQQEEPDRRFPQHRLHRKFPVDPAERNRLAKEVTVYLLDKAYVIDPPSPHFYYFWQPWIKNFYGIPEIGAIGGRGKYLWIDQELKQKMTGVKGK